jgi:hypothetical protein
VIEILAQIAAPKFHTNIVLQNDKVVEASAPVRYMRGWTRRSVREYCQERGWKVSVVSETRRCER